MKIRRQRRPAPGIDMSPMIDCVFQLLIFFMLSSSMMTPMIRLTLPKSSQKERPEMAEIVVTVDREGAVLVNTTPVAMNELEAKLASLVAASENKVVLFRGDEKAEFQKFVHVLDAARKAGAAHVSVAHLPK